MTVQSTKQIATAASRARNAVNNLRNAARYFTDRGYDITGFHTKNDSGEYPVFSDLELANIDGGAKEELEAMAQSMEARDAEITAEETAARADIDAMNNAATDGDEARAE